MAKGKAIRLSSGQMSLGAQRKPVSAFEAPLQPVRSDWHAADGGEPHPQFGLFPYETIRDGQKRFTRDVTLAIQRGKHLVAEAPTGIGKTAASIAPALAFAIENKKTVLFLTSRQSQHRIAVDTLRMIQEKRGARFLLVDLVSKRDMCLRDEAAEMHPGRFPDFCAHETRNKTCKYLGDVDEDTLRRVRDGVLHVEQLMQVSKESGLCPHLVAVAAAPQAQIIVADYNHLFSDMRERSLERFGLDLKDLIVIVDEAHNLPDRIKQNHAHRITPFLLDQVEGEAKTHRFGDVVADVGAIRTTLQELAAAALRDGRVEQGKMGDRQDRIARLAVPDLHDGFATARNQGTLGLHRTMQDAIDALQPLVTKAKKGTDAQVHAETLLATLEDWGRFRKGALRYLQWDDEGTTLHLRLLDPGVPATQVFQGVHSAVLMSGTLRPPEIVRDVLGLENERTLIKRYDSPFPPENRMTVIATGVSTRYTDRSAEMWDRMARIISQTATKCVNLAVFAPSYEILREVTIALDPYDVKKELIEESPGMTKAERDDVVDRLRGARKGEGAILMGVLGGSFAEGVDYPENLLQSVIVAGLPLPPPNLEVEATIGYYDRRFEGKGRLYAYVAPAMNKVLQAMGRGIRGPGDRCVNILLDHRFKQHPYRGFLPGETVASAEPQAVARRFLDHQP